jgi:hypothetical protein
MDYFSSEDLDSVAYIDRESKAVTLKFYGFPNEMTAQLFINYSMTRLKESFQPMNEDMKSKMIH